MSNTLSELKVSASFAPDYEIASSFTLWTDRKSSMNLPYRVIRGVWGDTKQGTILLSRNVGIQAPYRKVRNKFQSEKCST